MSWPRSAAIDPLPVEYGPGAYWLHHGFATATVVAHFLGDHWATSVVDLEGVADKADILDAFATGLSFPAWVGRNWDALDDALADLSWWPAGASGRVILVRGAETEQAPGQGDRQVLGEVLQTAIDSWAQTDSPLVLLLRP